MLNDRKNLSRLAPVSYVVALADTTTPWTLECGEPDSYPTTRVAPFLGRNYRTAVNFATARGEADAFFRKKLPIGVSLRDIVKAFRLRKRLITTDRHNRVTCRLPSCPLERLVHTEIAALPFSEEITSSRNNSPEPEWP